MKRSLAIVTVFMLLAAVFYVNGAKDQSAAEDRSANAPGISDGATGKGMMHHRMEMLRKAGVSEETLQQWQVLMKTQFYMDSPAALLAQADDLGLSQDQKQKLMAIQNDSRTKAGNVLTDEQRTRLQKHVGTPISFARLHKTIMNKMKAAHMSMDGGRGRMNCPCPMADEKREKADGGTTTQPTEN